ncbi:MAG: hypothetical protein VXY92_06455 [Planctomycetota bacterium]|nr:hypothetical protein [Planctomycetota bacterium]
MVSQLLDGGPGYQQVLPLREKRPDGVHPLVALPSGEPLQRLKLVRVGGGLDLREESIPRTDVIVDPCQRVADRLPVCAFASDLRKLICKRCDAALPLLPHRFGLRLAQAGCFALSKRAQERGHGASSLAAADRLDHRHLVAGGLSALELPAKCPRRRLAVEAAEISGGAMAEALWPVLNLFEVGDRSGLRLRPLRH